MQLIRTAQPPSRACMSLRRRSARRVHAENPAVTADHWRAETDGASTSGRELLPESLLNRVAAGGISGSSTRRRAWPSLLGMQACSGAASPKLLLESLEALIASSSQLEAWYEAKGAIEQFQFTVQRIGTDMDRLTTEPAFLSLGPASNRASIVATGKRVLAAYALTDPDLGYCQGMSDLLAPMLEIWDVACGEEAADLEGEDAAGAEELQIFLCFRQLMALVRGNFLEGMQKIRDDIASVRRQVELLDPPLHLHLLAAGAGEYQFCFQMLLLLFRREVPWEEANMLFDSLLAWHAVLVRREKTAGPGPGLSQPASEPVLAASSTAGSRPADLDSALQSMRRPGGDAAATADLLMQLDVLEASELEQSVFRRLCVGCSVALLMLNRHRLMECGSVEEVQRLSNRFRRPEGQSKGVGLHLAACAAAMVQGKDPPSSSARFCKAWRLQHVASDRETEMTATRRQPSSDDSASACCMSMPRVMSDV